MATNSNPRIPTGRRRAANLWLRAAPSLVALGLLSWGLQEGLWLAFLGTAHVSEVGGREIEVEQNTAMQKVKTVQTTAFR